MSEAKLGKFRILEEIGRGGYATVYRALDTTLDREVALKILHPQLLVDRSFVERFGREARALASLRHPAIVTVFEIAEAEGRLFIAMELARGPNLARLITEGGPMPWRAALGLLKPVCEALEYAHKQGVIHRDLKPTNILLDEERGALLSDFGFARLMTGSSVSLSLSGGVLGTPPYIAPEVWEFNAAEAPADVYALGCVVYEALTGQVLFGGETPMQALRAHDRGPEFPETWPEGVPDGVESVLAKALARDPGDRYASVGALWHALKDAEAQAQESREETEPLVLAAQWRAEAERSIAAGEWGVARMAVRRWLAAMPEDPDARAALARIDQQQASERPPEPTPSPSEPSPTPEKRSRPGVAEVKLPPAKRDVSTAPAERISAARPKKRRWLPTWGWVLAGLASVVLIIVLIVGINGREKEVEVTRAVVETVVEEKEVEVTRVVTEKETVLEEKIETFTVVEIKIQEETVIVAGTPQIVEVEIVQEIEVTRVVETIVELGIGSTTTRERDGAVMVYVRGGTFEMGSSEAEIDALFEQCEQDLGSGECSRSWFEGESPPHTVTLDSFWIDKYEVTNAQYRQCVETGACDAPTACDWGEPTYEDASKADHPVVCVDWYGARDYCEWAGARLPTEAEWEYAARGPDGNTYPWGDTFDGERLNFCDTNCEIDWKDTDWDDGYARTAQVGTYEAGKSWCDTMDMAGNVWEWVNDWYDADYYDVSPDSDPPGPQDAELKVLRGGSWGHYDIIVRSAYRSRGSPVITYYNGGFRCVGGSTSSP